MKNVYPPPSVKLSALCDRLALHGPRDFITRVLGFDICYRYVGQNDSNRGERRTRVKLGYSLSISKVGRAVHLFQAAWAGGNHHCVLGLQMVAQVL